MRKNSMQSGCFCLNRWNCFIAGVSFSVFTPIDADYIRSRPFNNSNWAGQRNCQGSLYFTTKLTRISEQIKASFTGFCWCKYWHYAFCFWALMISAKDLNAWFTDLGVLNTLATSGSSRTILVAALYFLEYLPLIPLADSTPKCNWVKSCFIILLIFYVHKILDMCEQTT